MRDKNEAKPFLDSSTGITLLIGVLPLAMVGIGAGLLAAIGVKGEGDPYNLVSAWVSATALSAVVISIRQQSKSLDQQEKSLDMQRRELRLQRRELALQRKELHATLEENKKMAEAQSASEKRLFLSAYVNSLGLLSDLTANRPEVHYGKNVAELLTAATLREMEFKLTRLTGLMDKQAQALFEGIYLKTDDDIVIGVLVSLVQTLEQITAETSVEDALKILQIVDIDVNGISHVTWRNSKRSIEKWQYELRNIVSGIARLNSQSDSMADLKARKEMKQKVFEAANVVKDMLADAIWYHEDTPILGPSLR